MNHTDIHIKNMVCPRCLLAVRNLFEQLNIPLTDLQLGLAQVQRPLSSQEEQDLRDRLQQLGFEWLDDPDRRLINLIKLRIVRCIQEEELPNSNWSDFLADELGHPYAHLSRTFSQQQPLTIEQYIQQQRIERVKELLSYGQWTISQIADRTGFGSSAYLSRQFRSLVGMSPSEWAQCNRSDRRTLDEI